MMPALGADAAFLWDGASGEEQHNEEPQDDLRPLLAPRREEGDDLLPKFGHKDTPLYLNSLKQNCLFHANIGKSRKHPCRHTLLSNFF